MNGESTPLLQLHGGTCTNDQLDPAFFAGTFQVVAPEQMGHGRTADDMSRSFHYHDMAEDTVALLRHLHIERALVLGFSDGGNIGLDMAIHHPDLVSRLVVTGANYNSDGCSAGAWEFVMTVDPDDWPQPQHDAYDRLSLTALPTGRSFSTGCAECGAGAQLRPKSSWAASLYRRW